MKLIDIVKDINDYMTDKYPQLSAENELTENQKNTYFNIIKDYIQQNKIFVDDYKIYQSTEKLIERLYWENKKYGPMTPYLDVSRTDVEELQINSWFDFKIQLSSDNGKTIRAEHPFLSEENCRAHINKVLRNNSQQWDVNMPIMLASIGEKDRVAAIGFDCIKKGRGAIATIRRINAANLESHNLVNNMVSKELWYDMALCCKWGISLLFAGKTFAGKTTIASILQKEAIPLWKRWHIIELEITEFETEIYDNEGNVINNSCTFITRIDENDPSRNIDLRRLVRFDVTMHPDVMFVSETKDKEAVDILKYGKSGHQAVTTIHAGSTSEAPDRFADLMDSNNPARDAFNVAQTFPICFFIDKLGTKSDTRRVMEMAEYVVKLNDQGQRYWETRTIWRYENIEFDYDKGGAVINVKGIFRKINDFSAELKEKLQAKGCKLEDIDKYSKVNLYGN